MQRISSEVCSILFHGSDAIFLFNFCLIVLWRNVYFDLDLKGHLDLKSTKYVGTFAIRVLIWKKLFIFCNPDSKVLQIVWFVFTLSFLWNFHETDLDFRGALGSFCDQKSLSHSAVCLSWKVFSCRLFKVVSGMLQIMLDLTLHWGFCRVWALSIIQIYFILQKEIILD